MFLLCVAGIFNKNAWVLPLKDEKGITIANVFLKVLDDSNRKPNRIWIIKAVNFLIDQINHDYKIMIQKFIRHIKKENLLLEKDLLQHKKKYLQMCDFDITNICILIN